MSILPPMPASQILFFLFGFGLHLVGAQSLLFTLSLGISPGGIVKPYGMLVIKFGSVACKLRAKLAIISDPVPSDIFF